MAFIVILSVSYKYIKFPKFVIIDIAAMLQKSVKEIIDSNIVVDGHVSLALLVSFIVVIYGKALTLINNVSTVSKSGYDMSFSNLAEQKLDYGLRHIAVVLLLGITFFIFIATNFFNVLSDNFSRIKIILLFSVISVIVLLNSMM